MKTCEEGANKTDVFNSVTCDFVRETRLVLLPEAFPTKVAPPTGRETRKLQCLS